MLGEASSDADDNRVRILYILTLFCLNGRCNLDKPLSALELPKIIYMISFKLIISVEERLCTDCKDATSKFSFVRGHFRVVNGRKIYVKAHYRKK